MRRLNFWASENWSRQVHFEGHSPEWQVLSKLSAQPWRVIVRATKGVGKDRVVLRVQKSR